MLEAILWTVYGIGVILTPIVAGLLCGKNAKFMFEDYVGIFFCAIMWPFILAVLVIFVVAVGVLWLPAQLFKGLVWLGVAIDYCIKPKKGKVDEHVYD